MLKQKLAIISATLFLLSTVILPGLTLAADDDDLTGTLVLTGTGDVWYDSYSTADIDDVTFVPKSAASTLNHTVGDTVTDNQLDKDDLIGVVNMKASAWHLTTDITDFSNGVGGTIPDENAYLAVASIDATHFASAVSIAVTHEGAGVTLAADATDDIFYVEQENSGYTYATGDVTTTATTTDLSVYSHITTAVDGATLIASAQTDAFGIFAVGVAYELEIPGGTTAGTYTATVTYTLNWD